MAAANRSSSVRSLRLPEGVSYESLHDALKLDGYVVYAGLGDAAKTTFRVCTLGAMELEVLADFVECLGRALEAARAPGSGSVRPGAAAPSAPRAASAVSA